MQPTQKTHSKFGRNASSSFLLCDVWNVVDNRHILGCHTGGCARNRSNNHPQCVSTLSDAPLASKSQHFPQPPCHFLVTREAVVLAAVSCRAHSSVGICSAGAPHALSIYRRVAVP